MIVDLENINKIYNQESIPVNVLNNVSLRVDKGDYIAIMGPSGSGKTTLMNIIGCLDVATTGKYLLDGEDVSKATDNRMSDIRNQKIGFVFQQFHLLPKLTAIENVALPLLYRDVSKAKRMAIAGEALEKVGLGDRKKFLPNQLSGGQCQRVAIARAMVGNPLLLLADEPTGALDTKAGEQIMELFKKLNDEGATIIMITHEPKIAECAKKIYHIRDGNLQEELK
ncbi:MAG: ABC transporter ATP-binding protein [Clostridia bacterium]|nr:ABC transporter ATP-binding protein [Clostridia bacterium]